MRVATTRKALGARAVVVRGGAGHAGGMGQGLFKQKPTKTMQKLNEIMIFWRKKRGELDSFGDSSVEQASRLMNLQAVHRHLAVSADGVPAEQHENEPIEMRYNLYHTAR